MSGAMATISHLLASPIMPPSGPNPWVDLLSSSQIFLPGHRPLLALTNLLQQGLSAPFACACNRMFFHACGPARCVGAPALSDAALIP